MTRPQASAAREGQGGTDLPKVHRHVVPREEWQVVKGYKTLVRYICEANSASVAAKDRAKQQTYRAWVLRNGQPDLVKYFRGVNALWQAQAWTHSAVMPPLTKEQIDALI